MKQNKEKQGFTLVEMLVTTLIVLMVSGILVTLTNMAFSTFEDSMKIAESQTLASTLKESLKDELYYATDVESDENGYRYFSVTSGLGSNCYIESRDGILCVSNGTDYYPLISKGSYVYNMSADCSITFKEEQFFVLLSIKDSDGNNLKEYSFTVKPTNANSVQ